MDRLLQGRCASGVKLLQANDAAPRHEPLDVPPRMQVELAGLLGKLCRMKGAHV